jgi:hypothetical protein
VAVVGTVGLASRGAARSEEPSTEAEFNAALDARLHQVLANILQSGRTEPLASDTLRR